MTRRALRQELDPHGKLLGRRDGDVAHDTVPRHGAAAFGEAVLGGDLIPVLIDHEVDADLRRSLLAGLGQKNHVALQLDVLTLEHEQQHQAGRHAVFVVE